MYARDWAWAAVATLICAQLVYYLVTKGGSQQGLPIGPPRKIGKTTANVEFLWPNETHVKYMPKRGQEDFFLLIRTLQAFWAQWIRILLFLGGFWIHRFLDFQIPGFPDSRLSHTIGPAVSNPNEWTPGTREGQKDPQNNQREALKDSD